jgi:MFS family permease
VLSAAMSLHYLTSAALIPLLARAHRQIGIARVTQAGAVFMAAGVIAWAHADSAGHLALAAFLTGVGWAATGTTAITAMISAWFDEDRPRALGLALNGISMGGLVFAPAWPAAIGGLGLSAATIVVGIGACLAICVLASVFLTPVGPYRPAQQHSHVEPAQPRHIIPTWKFQSVAISFGLSLLAAMGVLVHLSAYLAATWGLAAAGLAVSLVTVSTIAGRIIVWRWMQGLGVRASAAACFLVSAIGAALLTVMNMPGLVVVGCVFFGLGGASLNFIPSLIAQREYDASVTPTVVGLFGSAAQLAIVVAPFAMGALSDAFGAYRGPFLLAALLLSSAAVLILSHRDRD